MNNTRNMHFKLGAGICAALLGGDPTDLTFAMSKEATLQSEDGAPYHRELCKIAAAAFLMDGDKGSPVSCLFQNLAKSEVWDRGYNRFSDCVRRALSKNASLLPAVSGVGMLHDKLGGDVVKTLTAGGALSGAALGSLAFLLSRDARQSSAENSALLEKVKAYKQLRRDIEEDMTSQGLTRSAPPPKERRYAV